MAAVLRAELRHSPMLAAVPVLAFLGGLATWRDLIPGVATWEATSQALLGGTQLIGPVAAGLACWIAQRERRRRLAYLRVLSADRAPAVPLLQLAAAVLWSVAAYLSVGGAVSLHTLVHHGTGRPSLGAVAVGCLGVAVHVAVGYLAGMMAGWRALPPLVALACYVAVAIGMDYGGSSLYLLSPVTVEIANVFLGWQGGVFAAQAGWLLAVLAVLVALIAMRGRVTRIAVVAGLAALFAAVPAAQRVAAYDGHLFADGIPATARVCEGTAPQVCLHPAYRRAAEPIRREFAPLVHRLAGTPARITVLQHRAPWDRSPLAPGVMPLYLEDLAPGYGVRAREAFVQALTDGDKCAARDGPEAWWYSELVSSWLLDEPPFLPSELVPANDRLTRATEEQRRAWFAAHFAAYRDCALTAASFSSLP
jgi:hypothetical protein